MTDNTRNQQIQSAIKKDVVALHAITEAFGILVADAGDQTTPEPEVLLSMAVFVLLNDGHEVLVDYVSQIAGKRSIGLSADEAMDVIIEHDEFLVEAGRVQLAEGKVSHG